jgi:methionyl-tRNA synthetase
MPESSKKFYLTTPIYYVNARPHIGHAYTTIVADVVARRHRLLGDDTYFLTGTDEHGQKIERAAAAAGIAPQQFADEVSASFEGLWKRMGITNNAYIRTTDERHKKGVQKLFSALYEKGYIYLASYTGQYCVSDEAFVDVGPGEACPDCGRITETLTEENFFFKLSEFQRKLIDLIESDGLAITPDSRKNEVLSFLRGNIAPALNALLNAESAEEKEAANRQLSGDTSTLGNAYVPGALKDLSISRSSFTWGIPVPEPAASAAKQKHVIYVWLDALANYITALGYGSDDETNFNKYWPADLHLVGKEIIRFHCVYWPAFLLAAGIELPKQITAHGWLLFDSSKMSKSKGNIIRTETILDAFGEQVYGKQFPESTKAERDLFASDVLRYFLLREIPFGQDGNFSLDALVTRYNADLANGYGNLVSRTLTLTAKSRASAMPSLKDTRLIDDPGTTGTESVIWSSQETARMFSDAIAQYRFGSALEQLWTFVAIVDGYISVHTPWKLATDQDPLSQARLDELLSTCAESIRIITALLYPILPFATASVWRQLGLGEIEDAAKNGELKDLRWGGLKPGTKLGALAPIFPRADKGLVQIMNDMESPVATTVSDEAATHHPAAGPRTSTIAEANPGAKVAGSHALTTERTGTPSHTEAQASGVFAGQSTTGNQTVAGGDSTAAASGAATIGIDDFAKIDLRVAQIVVAERIPKADKLLRLEVDLGYEKRQILSGIAEWYTPEELVGRRIAIIANLAPRKMRGLESHGMLLAASGENHASKPILASFSDEIALGSKIR